MPAVSDQQRNVPAVAARRTTLPNPLDVPSVTTLGLSTHQWMEQGLVTPHINIPTVLIQDSWSMWEIVLPTLGFRVICQVLDGEEICGAGVQGQAFVLSGSLKFVSTYWTKCIALGQVIASLSRDERPEMHKLPRANWVSLQHKLCDGVVACSWWCGPSFDYCLDDYPKVSGRRLRHIILPMHKGWKVSGEVDSSLNQARPIWTPQGFHFGGLLPIRKLADSFLCPSVFKSL